MDSVSLATSFFSVMSIMLVVLMVLYMVFRPVTAKQKAVTASAILSATVINFTNSLIAYCLVTVASISVIEFVFRKDPNSHSG